MKDYLEALKTGEVTHIDRDVVDKLFPIKESKGPEVEMHAPKGILSGLAGFKISQYNIGKPAAGLVVAALNDVAAGLIQGVVGKHGKHGKHETSAGKLAMAIPSIVGLGLLNTKMAQGWLGSEAIEAGNIILFADLFTDYIFPIRAKVSGLVGGLRLRQTEEDTVDAEGDGYKEITSIEEYNRVYGLA